MENLVHILIPLAGIAMVFGVVYVVISANNKENMAMIEAGMNPKSSKAKGHSKLRNALLAVTVPIGILIGNLTYDVFDMEAAPTAVVFAFLFGGLGLIATYFIERTQSNRNDDGE